MLEFFSLLQLGNKFLESEFVQELSGALVVPTMQRNAMVVNLSSEDRLLVESFVLFGGIELIFKSFPHPCIVANLDYFGRIERGTF